MKREVKPSRVSEACDVEEMRCLLVSCGVGPRLQTRCRCRASPTIGKHTATFHHIVDKSTVWQLYAICGLQPAVDTR